MHSRHFASVLIVSDLSIFLSLYQHTRCTRRRYRLLINLIFLLRDRIWPSKIIIYYTNRDIYLREQRRLQTLNSVSMEPALIVVIRTPIKITTSVVSNKYSYSFIRRLNEPFPITVLSNVLLR